MNEDLSIKVTKDDAFYTITRGPEGRRCGDCRNRLGPTACTIVRGNISDWAYCDYFEARTVFDLLKKK